jgi:hypothetical protein
VSVEQARAIIEAIRRSGRAPPLGCCSPLAAFSSPAPPTPPLACCACRHRQLASGCGAAPQSRGATRLPSTPALHGAATGTSSGRACSWRRTLRRSWRGSARGCSAPWAASRWTCTASSCTCCRSCCRMRTTAGGAGGCSRPPPWQLPAGLPLCPGARQRLRCCPSTSVFARGRLQLAAPHLLVPPPGAQPLPKQPLLWEPSARRPPPTRAAQRLVHAAAAYSPAPCARRYPGGAAPRLVLVAGHAGLTLASNEAGFSERDVRALCDVDASAKAEAAAGGARWRCWRCRPAAVLSLELERRHITLQEALSGSAPGSPVQRRSAPPPPGNTRPAQAPRSRRARRASASSRCLRSATGLPSSAGPSGAARAGPPARRVLGRQAAPAPAPAPAPSCPLPPP